MDNNENSNLLSNFESSIKWLVDKREELSNILPASLQELISLVSETVGDASTAIGIIQNIVAIPQKLFIKNVVTYLTAIGSEIYEIPEHKRKKYIAKADKIFQKEAGFTLSILQRNEEELKGPIFAKLFATLVNEDYNSEGYRRIMLQTNRTLYSDLMFMKANICNEELTLSTEELQSLSANGWLVYAGVKELDFGDDSIDTSLYRYTESAKKFCELVFGIDIDARPSANESE